MPNKEMQWLQLSIKVSVLILCDLWFRNTTMTFQRYTGRKGCSGL